MINFPVFLRLEFLIDCVAIIWVVWLAGQGDRCERIARGRDGVTFFVTRVPFSVSLAWVKGNNPRQYIKEGRYDKTKQPTGDVDCKLGDKKQHNRLVTTPAKEGTPAETIALKDKEFYWGYASGAVVTKLSNWGEFVLAEMTQTFDTADVRYFFPLMDQVEKRLGFRPLFAALDAAFDAFYIYQYFHNEAHDGFVAVLLKQPNSQPCQFDAQGQPLCAADLPMPVRKLYTDNTKAIMGFPTTGLPDYGPRPLHLLRD